MLMPKRVKRRKQFRGSMKGKALRGNKINYGEFGLVALEPCWIKSNQIEAARIAMTRYIKRGGKVWIKIFPDKPVTAQTAIPPSRNCQSAFVFRIRIQLAAAGISINKDMAQKYIASLPVSSRKPAAKP